jgi:hypothetical protein
MFASVFCATDRRLPGGGVVLSGRRGWRWLWEWHGRMA